MKDTKKGSLYYVLFTTTALDSVQQNISFPPENYVQVSRIIAHNEIIILLDEHRRAWGKTYVRCLTSSGVFWINRKHIRKISLVEQHDAP